ncbi:MAG TPA: PqiC family protein [Candidatus Binatia bacterium]|nr:PqiC family protein [Candidatus Binatia bacterium]
MHRLCTIFAVFTLTVFLMGCGSTPPSRFYTLSAASGTAAGSSKLSVLVGPVAVPALVDRPQIVVDAGANQVRLDDFNRWAAPLQSAIARVVADNLVAMLGTPQVTLSSQTLSADADFRATIDVQSFQSAPGDAATLDAVWTVRRIKDGKSETGRTTAREPVAEKSYDALAAAHSRALARLSQDIAAAVRSLDR